MDKEDATPVAKEEVKLTEDNIDKEEEAQPDKKREADSIEDNMDKGAAAPTAKQVLGINRK